MAKKKKKKAAKKKAAKKKERGKRPPPIVLSFVVCDDVITDARSKKNTLVGVFHDIFSLGFPAVHAKISIFLELTNGHGLTNLELRLVYASTDEQLFSTRGQIDFSDPRVVASLVFSVNNIALQRKGEYRFQLYADGELLIERRVVASLVKRDET